MRKVILYIAISLNGKIARKDGNLDWLETLPNPDKTDYGFNAFNDSIDTTIQGYNTYELILKRGIENPAKDKENYVFTRRQEVKDNRHVKFVKNNVGDFVRNLKQQEGKNIWLIGGGQINTLLFNENLIDELRVFVMPIVIPDGIELFEFVPDQKIVTLIENRSYSSGAVELHYKVS